MVSECSTLYTALAAYAIFMAKADAVAQPYLYLSTLTHFGTNQICNFTHINFPIYSWYENHMVFLNIKQN